MRTNAFKFLSPNEAADFLGVSPCTLFNWRAQLQGPDYVRLGGRIRYPEHALTAFVAARTVHVGEREAALIPNN